MDLKFHHQKDLERCGLSKDTINSILKEEVRAMSNTNGGRKTSTEMNIRENFVFDEPFKARVV